MFDTIVLYYYDIHLFYKQDSFYRKKPFFHEGKVWSENIEADPYFDEIRLLPNITLTMLKNTVTYVFELFATY